MLIIEDDDDIRRDLVETFVSPASGYVDAYQIPAFLVDEAATGSEADAFLSKAAVQFAPYDIVLLDIGLPQDAHSKNPSREVGAGLLKSLKARYSGACIAVIIESVHTELPIFLDALRQGAADFLPKPFSNEEIVRSVAQVYKAAHTRLANQWNACEKQRRERWLLVQTCAKVADEMAKVISDGLGDVVEKTRALGTLIHEYYQLDETRDRSHPICAALAIIQKMASDLGNDCAVKRSSFSPDSGPMSKMRIADVVNEAIDSLRPGFAYKHSRVNWPGGGGQFVHTFRDDIGMIVQELIFNAVETSPEGSTIGVSLQSKANEQSLELLVKDESSKLNDQARKAIAKGEVMGQSFGRGWGLALAQRVATNIGLRLRIESSKSGNTVVLSIPRSAND